MAEKQGSGERVVATNKKAFHDYFILEKLEAGIVLVGTEVKAIREGRLNLKDSYASIRAGEAFLLNCHKHGSFSKVKFAKAEIRDSTVRTSLVGFQTTHYGDYTALLLAIMFRDDQGAWFLKNVSQFGFVSFLKILIFSPFLLKNKT